jgi:hypothetical protein
MFNGARADFYLLALLSSSVLRVTFFVDYRFTLSAIPRSLFSITITFLTLIAIL